MPTFLLDEQEASLVTRTTLIFEPLPDAIEWGPSNQGRPLRRKGVNLLTADLNTSYGVFLGKRSRGYCVGVLDHESQVRQVEVFSQESDFLAAWEVDS